jgi:hypothetical protein
MASLEMTIPHQLSQDEALKRIKNLLSDTRKEHGDLISNLQENWNGYAGQFSFSAKGYDISGHLIVQPSSIEINSTIPFAVSLFKGTITKLIREKADELLS